MPPDIPNPGLSPEMTALLAMGIIVAFLLLFVLFWYGWWLTRREASESPYTGLPLRRASGISYAYKEKTLRFLHDMHQYENRIFEFKKAGFCRETGRIFPNCVTWYDVIRLDWTFLQRRFPGEYVSWGSLTKDQQEGLKSVHDPVTGFQTIYSSTHPSPRLVEAQYAYEKPGPLYVDVRTGTLVGWQIVPDTDLEVLIVQKPVKIISINVPQE